MKKLALFVLLVLTVAVPASAQAKPKFKAYASCDNAKPFKAAHHCRYDKPLLFRGTMVFESNVGKVPVKACFRLFGPKPVGGGHACVKLGPLAYKAYPLKISGVRQRFSSKIVWYAKVKKGAAFKPVASAFVKVNP